MKSWVQFQHYEINQCPALSSGKLYRSRVVAHGSHLLPLHRQFSFHFWRVAGHFLAPATVFSKKKKNYAIMSVTFFSFQMPHHVKELVRISPSPQGLDVYLATLSVGSFPPRLEVLGCSQKQWESLGWDGASSHERLPPWSEWEKILLFVRVLLGPCKFDSCSVQCLQKRMHPSPWRGAHRASVWREARHSWLTTRFWSPAQSENVGPLFQGQRKCH